jgi:precorrin-2 dehydrogenase/sirohydrochlorin ferrochelatase
VIPLLHDFRGERVLVVGGGSVGARKARRFAREADVVVLSPAFAEAEFGGVERVRAALTPDEVPEWIERVDPALVVAATDDTELNAALERTARERGLLVNRADTAGERDPGSVVVPATVRDGPVVAAVGTGGLSPTVSRHLREQIESVVDGAGALARLTGDLRADLVGLSAAERRRALRAVVESERVRKDLDTGSPTVRRTAEEVVADVTGLSGGKET